MGKRRRIMNNELLKEKIYEELNSVIEEITQVELEDEMIPTLSGWELALKWVLNVIEEEENK
jgi:hypothetical protein